MIYLDANATTPIDGRVLNTIVAEFTELGNASSHHAAGRRAHAVVQAARASVADLLGAAPTEVVFTSGATEADNLALLGLTPRGGRRGVACPGTEHAAVLEPVNQLRRQGCPTTLLPVDETGQVDLRELERCVGSGTLLVSVMAVNNETGVKAPLAQIAAVVHAAGALLHSDATQLMAWGDVDVDVLDVDMLSLSAHKMHGPVGVGALYVRREIQHLLSPRVFGGGQETGLRSGTLNTPGIAGLGHSARLAADEGAAAAARVGALRDDLRDRLAAAQPVLVHGAGTDRAPGTLNLALAGALADQVLAGVPGVAASRGSACSGGSEQPSHVLTAMGVPRDVVDCSVRFSLHRGTTAADVREAAGLVAASAARVRRRNGAAASGYADSKTPMEASAQVSVQASVTGSMTGGAR